MASLINVLEEENPEDPELAPQVCLFSIFNACMQALGQPSLSWLRLEESILMKPPLFFFFLFFFCVGKQGMAGWARVYVKYVSIYRSLEECYDQAKNPTFFFFLCIMTRVRNSGGDDGRCATRKRGWMCMRLWRRRWEGCWR